MAIADPRGRLQLTLAGPHHTSRSLNVSAQTLVNWYLEFQNVQEKSATVLYPDPGTTLVSSIGVGPFRGSIVHKGECFFVSGSELLKMTSLEAVSSVGTLSTSTGRVSIASNGTFGNQLIIVDGTDGYIWDGSTLTTIADAQFPASPTQVVYVDTYFIVIADDSGQFNISASADGTAWDALDFANAERQPDNTLAIETLKRDIYFVGEYTTEIWTNTGGRFPFEPYGNGILEFGTVSPWCVSKYEDGVVFVTNTVRGQGKVVLLKGTNSRIISNTSIENELFAASTLENCHSFIYEWKSHVFYQLTVPELETTFVCDLTINDPEYAWHKKSTNDLRHIASTHVFFNKKHYVGSYIGPELYYLDNTKYTDSGTTIKRERAGIHLAKNRVRFRYDRLELEFEAGTGLLAGQGSDPKVMLDWSDDGGHTWSNIRYLSIGGIGQYKNRCIAHHLGSSIDRIFRIRVSDPVNFTLIDGYVYGEELLF